MGVDPGCISSFKSFKSLYCSRLSAQRIWLSFFYIHTYYSRLFIVVANCLLFSAPAQFFFFFRKLFGSSCSLSCASAGARLIRSSQCQAFVQPAPLSLYLLACSPASITTPTAAAKREREWNGVTDSICELPGAYTSVHYIYKRYVFKKLYKRVVDVQVIRESSNGGIISAQKLLGAVFLSDLSLAAQHSTQTVKRSRKCTSSS